jgi:hypothetical protein
MGTGNTYGRSNILQTTTPARRWRNRCAKWASTPMTKSPASISNALGLGSRPRTTSKHSRNSIQTAKDQRNQRLLLDEELQRNRMHTYANAMSSGETARRHGRQLTAAPR